MTGTEEWKVIAGTNGRYSISTRRRVRPNAAVITVEKPVRERILKPKDGRWVSLSVDGIRNFADIGHLMREAFGCDTP
jgi:hypothetical protein